MCSYVLSCESAADLTKAHMDRRGIAYIPFSFALGGGTYWDDLIKGGRISKTAGTIGGLLGICPLLNVSADGRLIPREKVRSKKRVIQAIAEKMALLAEGGENYTGKCFISHSACEEDARQVAELVEARFPKLNGRVEINSIGPAIGSPTGPGTVALFFWGSPRAD